MKINLAYFTIIIIIIGCNRNNSERNETKNEHINHLHTLIENNVNYFIKEDPLNYMLCQEYTSLLEIEKLVSNIFRQLDNNKIDTVIVNEYIKVVHEQETKFNDKLVIINTKQVENLLLQTIPITNVDEIKANMLFNLYIIGNELIKQYNYYLFRKSHMKIEVVSEKDIISFGGNIYEADIEFSCSDVRPFIVVVEGDTLDYKNGVPYYKTILEHKGNIIKKGVFSIYREGRADYYNIPFDIEINVK